MLNKQKIRTTQSLMSSFVQKKDLAVVYSCLTIFFFKWLTNYYHDPQKNGH